MSISMSAGYGGVSKIWKSGLLFYCHGFLYPLVLETQIFRPVKYLIMVFGMGASADPNQYYLRTTT